MEQPDNLPHQTWVESERSLTSAVFEPCWDNIDEKLKLAHKLIVVEKDILGFVVLRFFVGHVNTLDLSNRKIWENSVVLVEYYPKSIKCKSDNIIRAMKCVCHKFMLDSCTQESGSVGQSFLLLAAVCGITRCRPVVVFAPGSKLVIFKNDFACPFPAIFNENGCSCEVSNSTPYRPSLLIRFSSFSVKFTYGSAVRPDANQLVSNIWYQSRFVKHVSHYSDAQTCSPVGISVVNSCADTIIPVMMWLINAVINAKTRFPITNSALRLSLLKSLLLCIGLHIQLQRGYNLVRDLFGLPRPVQCEFSRVDSTPKISGLLISGPLG